MPNATWPASLPPPQANSGAAYQPASNVVRSNMDAGVAKVRRRFTAVVTPFNCSLKLTQAQYETLIDFYENTLQDALPFDWTDFRTGQAASYRFIQRPSGAFLDRSINRWKVSLQLERLP
ncbi:MAG TPA: hypothetical protein VFH59_07815 [Frateuria sp.]|uniref:hypothetical protein n=1 Tax=Frateuria sp. TaxID=2211372 RepID=UPI002D80C624|nr:hypothetical protein [Frateuria sp.]HET6805328.1 hypothetical protein [Frateuria sp.]